MRLKPGKKVEIHSYKHDGSLHRVWMSSFVIEDSNKFLVTGNDHTKVIESTGRSWYTKEPAICYFFDDEWFNIIAMLKPDGIHYYCNISSPYLYDTEAIKYIDYDLDIRIYPNGKLFVLDQKEFKLHSDDMNYPEDVKEIILKTIDKLKLWIEEKRPPFDKKSVLRKHKQFTKIFNHYKDQIEKKKLSRKRNE